MTFRRVIAIAILVVGLMSAASIPVFAQTKPCNGQTICTSDEVGPFMQGVSVGCGNLGNCELTDIKQVIVNIGNWILGIVGSLVLLFCIWGGIQFLTSSGDSGRIKAGKESIKKATLGLVIVFVAGIAIYTLKDTLLTGSVGGTGGTFITCTGAGTAGKTCGTRMVCNETGQCVDACLFKYTDRRCVNATNAQVIYPGSQCEKNLCSDPSDIMQCCQVPASLLNATP